MYLTKRTYVKNWDHLPAENRHEITVKRGDKVVTHIRPGRISEITEDVAYWRKANAIHKWFVDNVQDGIDNGGTFYVSREKLKELLNLCKTVLASSMLIDGKVQNGQRYENGTWVPILEDGKTVKDPTTAKILLPTQEGFFFGSTDYDQYYVEDLKETVEQLTAILDEPDEGDLYYHASW